MTGFTDRGMFNDGSPEARRPIVLVLELLDTRRPKVVLVRERSGATAWLPRKLITVEPATRTPHRVTLPTWLAQDRGLSVGAGKGEGNLF